MELNNSRESSSSKGKKDIRNKKNNGAQKEKKRKREEDCEEDDTEENNELTTKNGEKVFMETRTGRAHYLQVIKEMEYIKGMPSATLLSNMIEWVLSCEIKRQKSKNINGYLTRQMREYLIKFIILYCTIEEVQKQKDNTETGKIIKQMEEMRKSMLTLKEENRRLRTELEQLKENIKQTSPSNLRSENRMTQESNEKDIQKEIKIQKIKKGKALKSLVLPLRLKIKTATQGGS